MPSSDEARSAYLLTRRSIMTPDARKSMPLPKRSLIVAAIAGLAAFGMPAASPARAAGDAGAATLAALTLPAGGWFSGASGAGTGPTSTAFGTWRGAPVTIITTWQDGANGANWGWGPSSEAFNFKGLVDVAPGGPSDWSAAANGSLDVAWRDYLTRLRAERTIDGVAYPTILRPAHEMNGTWYPWSVSSGEVTAFRQTMKRWEAIADQAYPTAIYALDYNGETNGSASSASLFEAGVYDLIGTNRYNQWPYIGKSRSGTTVTWADGSMRGSDTNPIGAERWRLFAEKRGLPLYFPEYANNGDAQGSQQSGDDPYWVRKFIPWVDANAGKTAGKVFAEAWFNVDMDHDGWHVCCMSTSVEHPNVAGAYAALFPRP